MLMRCLVNSNCIIQPGGNRKGGLYLGNLQGAQDLKQLKENKINAVVSMTKNSLKYPKGFIKKHLTIEATDLPRYNIKQHFTPVAEFIEKWQRHGNVYIHCQAGISRSSTMVMAYLIKTKNMSSDEAFAFVKKLKRNIMPNEGFTQQLAQYEKEVLSLRS